MMKASTPICTDANGTAVGRADVAQRFVFHRFAMLTGFANRGLARSLTGRFGLTLSEWRVMSVIGERPGISANAVCRLTAMDKVRVSRAVSRLLEQGRVTRDVDAADRRRSKLYLSEDGGRLQRSIEPIAGAYHRMILEPFTEEEAAQFDALLGKLEHRLTEIAERGFPLSEPEAPRRNRLTGSD